MPLDAAIGKYLPRITPADAMVIDFGVRNWKSLSEASVKKACNGPSTQHPTSMTYMYKVFEHLK